jgi:hypothetical protein
MLARDAFSKGTGAMKKTVLLIAGLAALAASPAFANPTCLQINMIDTWKVPDDKTLIVEDNFHNRFKVGLMGTCAGLSFKERVGFKTLGETQMSCLSAGDDVIIHNFGTGGQLCPIRSVVPYTPDMEKADQAAAAAKADSSAAH